MLKQKKYLHNNLKIQKNLIFSKKSPVPGEKFMKIAFIGTMGIPPKYGGAEKCINEVAPRLANWGHDVTVYGSKRFYLGKTSTYKGVKLHLMPYFHVKWFDFPTRRILSVLHSLGRKFDIVHLWGADCAAYSVLYRFFPKTKTIISLIGPEWEQKSYPRIVKGLFRLTIDLPRKIVDSIIVDSIPIHNFYINRYGIKPIYIPYGAKFDIDESNDPILKKFGIESNKYLLFVGRLLPGKGIDLLIEAYKKLNGPLQENYPLLIIGDDAFSGRYLKKLKKLVNNNKNIKFIGAVYSLDVHKYYQKTALFISPSFLEGTSPAILEAMGCGRCVIAADIPMNKATIGDNGVFFKAGDHHDLSLKIETCLKNDKMRKKSGLSNANRVKKHFSWDVIAKKFELAFFNTFKQA